MELRITTLIENMQGENDELLYEHGLSLYIEFAGKKILFDTGQSGDYLDNAARLNKSVKEVDYLIVSHGHYDHSGGIKKSLYHLNKNVKMLVGKEFFYKKYKKLTDGTYKFNGNSFTEKEIQEARVDLVKLEEDTTWIEKHLVIFKNFRQNNDYELRNPKFMVQKEGIMLEDDFSDEIVLGLVTTKGLVIVAGCSHIGILNILTTIKERVNLPIYAVIGGTHLVEADVARINKTISELKKLKIEKVAVSHCTGELGIELMKQELQNHFILNSTGNVLEF